MSSLLVTIINLMTFSDAEHQKRSFLIFFLCKSGRLRKSSRLNEPGSVANKGLQQHLLRELHIGGIRLRLCR